jgi:hypothetical protein
LARLGLGLALLTTASCRSGEVTGVSSLAPAFDLGSAAVLTVANTNDAGPGSLRQAIDDAVDGDVIQFDPSIAGETITLSGQLEIMGTSITIEGSAAKGITLNAGGASRVLFVSPSAELTLSNATISGGRTISNTGGGISNFGTLVIRNSTISGNLTDAGQGGGIYNAGILTVVNSTISNNDAVSGGVGGAIYSDGAVQLINTTVTENTGVGIVQFSGTFTLRNTVVAGNTGAIDNCASAVGMTLAGVNLSNDGTCGAAGPGMIVADPQLGPLADNGGPTRTHNLLKDSPAIDAALGCTVTDDQRYVTRPQGTTCDIGAVEFNEFVNVTLAVDPSPVVNPTTGVAIVSGTISCSAPATIPLEIALSQVQKSKRVTSTVQASGSMTVDCTGTMFWSASMAAASGAFVNGVASVTVKSVNTGKSVIPAAVTGPVKLFWSHK